MNSQRNVCKTVVASKNLEQQCSQTRTRILVRGRPPPETTILLPCWPLIQAATCGHGEVRTARVHRSFVVTPIRVHDEANPHREAHQKAFIEAVLASWRLHVLRSPRFLPWTCHVHGRKSTLHRQSSRHAIANVTSNTRLRQMPRFPRPKPE